MADLTITAANVKIADTAAKVEVVTAGATITAGDALYLDTSLSKWKLADCTTSATTAEALRIALDGGSDGDAIMVAKPNTLITIGATLNDEIYVLSTGGLIAPSADLTTSDYITVIGFRYDASTLMFRPDATGYVAP